jgi:hypothetical protein
MRRMLVEMTKASVNVGQGCIVSVLRDDSVIDLQ